MALRQIMLGKKIEQKKSEFEELRAKDADFQIREEELEKAMTRPRQRKNRKS